MQKVTLTGFLGRDAAVRETKNGDKFVSLTLGANGMSNGVQKSSWYDIIWYNFSENMLQYLKKGSALVVGGDLDADLEVGSDGVTRCRRKVVADFVTFNSTSKSNDGDSEKAQQETKSEQQPTEKKKAPVKTTVEDVKPADDSDLPF